MPRPTGPSNDLMRSLIEDIRAKGYKKNSRFLLTIAEKLNKPSRRRAEINVSKINRYASEGETVIVPGKVLSVGLMEKKVTVAAWRFSEQATEKIEKAGGKCISISELLKTNENGKGVRILC